MSYSKILDVIFGVIGCLGFFLIACAAGTSDYAVEMHLYEPTTAHMTEIVIGLVLIATAITYMRVRERRQANGRRKKF